MTEINEKYNDKLYCMSCGEGHHLNGIVKLAKVKWVCPECTIKLVNEATEE